MIENFFIKLSGHDLKSFHIIFYLVVLAVSDKSFHSAAPMKTTGINGIYQTDNMPSYSYISSGPDDQDDIILIILTFS